MIFGREKLVKQLYNILKHQSILFTGERRVGKTFVLDELVKTPPENTQVIYTDLEKVDSPLEFVNDILNKTKYLFNNKDQAKSWLEKLHGIVGGVEVGGIIKIPQAKEKEWKDLLQTTLAAICNNTDDTIVFLWDEMPYMLQTINVLEIANNSTAKTSLQILDTLRTLRKEQPKLRMIFTGSIGLHHVLNEITGEHLSAEPVNDMDKVSISPLTKEAAIEMIKVHLDNENIKNASMLCMNIIAKECDYIPFYIEKLIRRLSLKEKK